MQYLFIAEKPSLMREVEKVYKKHKNEVESVVGGSILFTALHGHICQYANPKSYPNWNKRWKDLPLPMIPDEWKIETKKGETKTLQSLKKMMETCDGLIVGTDADVEGNGIFWLLAQKAKWQGIPTLRFFVNDLTEKSILASLTSMEDFYTNPRDVRMTQCYLLRSRFDWEVGMNATVAATNRFGSLLKIGRVKAPTLKLIYDNDKAITNFVPTTTYLVNQTYGEGFDGILIDGNGKPLELKTKAEAEQIIGTLTSPTARVESISKKESKTYAPKLYKLSDLQTEAGGKYGYSPSEVLGAAQSLYEKHKVLSYPRTDGRYLSTEKAKELPDILEAVGSTEEYSSIIAKIPQSAYGNILAMKNYVNDVQVKKASHDALLPTTTKPKLENMSQIERRVYDLVVRRVVAILYPPLVSSKTSVVADRNGKKFLSQGTIVIQPGYSEVLGSNRKDVRLPNLEKGALLHVEETKPKEKTTKPPKRLTEATLIQAMENIASVFEEKEYQKIMKESSGIGTPASRATIIDELHSAGYFKVEKKALYPTTLGKQYIETFRNLDVVDPVMTAKMELKMKQVKEGDENYETVRSALKGEVNKIIRQIQEVEIMQESKDIGTCPFCGGQVVRSGNKITCQEGDLNFYGKVAGRELSDEEVEDLLTKRHTKVLKGFTSKKGKKFNAMLELNEDGQGVSFNFDHNDEEVEYHCPICGEPMREFSWGYSCAGYSKGTCKFAVSKVVAKKKLTKAQINSIMNKGKSPLIHGFMSKKGNEFEAYLVVDKENQNLSFEFDD